MAERGNPVLRFADGVAGPPLLRGLAVLRRKAIRPAVPKRIGVLCFGALGDLLLLSSVTQDLQAAYPDAEVIFIGSKANQAIAPMLPVKTFVTLPVTRPDKALRELRRLKLDILLDSTQWAKLPAVLCALSGSFTVGFQTAGQRRHFAYDTVVEHLNTRHEIDNFRDLVGRIAPMTGVLPQLLLTETNRTHLKDLSLGTYAVLHAWPSGVRSDLKEWPLESWAKVAHHLHQRGLNVVLTGAPVDAVRSAELAAAIGPHPWVYDMAGKMKLPETGALLEKAGITVSVNTGIMHMAATFDRPLVGLSGPTNPLRWGPLSQTSYSPKPLCEGCWYLNLGFEYPQIPPDCMAAIPAEDVTAAIDELL